MRHRNNQTVDEALIQLIPVKYCT